MSEINKNPFEPFFEQIRQIVRDEIRTLTDNDAMDERFLSVDEAAELLSVSPDWVYRNAKKLPFTRKLGPKMLRFSYQGLVKWVAGRKLSGRIDNYMS